MTDCSIGIDGFSYDGGVRRFIQALIEQRGADSDVAQTVDFLANNGACFAEGDVYAHLRFVKLLGDDKRNEVLLVYLERVEDVSDDLADKSRESDEWSTYCQSLYERATKLFSIATN
jgi:hypothetical protein